MGRSWMWAEEERVAALVKRCVDARQLKQVQAHVVASGQSQNNFLTAKLVRAFTELGSLDHGRAVADGVSSPNAFVWTALIRGCSLSDNSCREALLLYTRMHRSPGVKPLTFTLSSVIKTCGQMSALGEGEQIHAHAFKHGFRLDARVQTTLIDLYSKCGRVVDARQVFDGILRAGGGRGDVQAWNTMIAGYAAAGDMVTAQALFEGMPERNSFTLVEMIAGYANAGQMDSARQLFDTTPDDKTPVVCTAMITGYAKCGDLPSAQSVFDEMTERDVASWNATISAYVHTNLTDEALHLFSLMLTTTGRCKVEPNQATIATVVSACAQFGSPRLASWIQEYIDSRGSVLLNSHTVAALIDLHSKCGDVGRAYDLFRWWKHKDLICYTSMIAGFGIHGRGKDAIRVFDELQEAGLKPDAVCFIPLFTACSHAGMVKEGWRYFEEMRDVYCIPPTADHYMCIVDMLGRAGCIDEAYRLITKEMALGGLQPHAGVWGALLSACRIYGNVEVGQAAAAQLMDLEPENTGNYVLLSNIYAKARRWEGVARVRAVMRRQGMRKLPGCSWLEVEGGRVQRFLTAEVCDGRLEMALELLGWELRAQGYIPTAGELDKYEEY